jgi:hypothetical protein
MFVFKKRVITSLLTTLTITLLGPIFPATATALSTDYEITSFEVLVDVAGGTAGAATYADAAAVIVALPTSAYASSSRFSVLLQVTTWIDTDGYDSNSDGSYTFTADLGTLPDEWTNPGAIPLTVEVIIAPADLGTPDVNISNSAIEGVTPPAAGAVPVEVITPNDQFTGTVSWADKDGPLIGNFNSSTIYKATISLSAASGYIF